jgi:hypothetical protein
VQIQWNLDISRVPWDSCIIHVTSNISIYLILESMILRIFKQLLKYMKFNAYFRLMLLAQSSVGGTEQ